MNKIKRKTIIVLILSGLLTSSNAQDKHFSQFYYSPLNLNPALTGAIEGNFRTMLNYRNQWRGITSPFVTTSFGADVTLRGTEWGEDWFGSGLVIVNDKAGSGGLSDLRLMLSGSYFKWLDQYNYVSAGVQAGIVQRKIDFSSFEFESQFVNNSPDPGITQDKISSFNFDMHAGAAWFFKPNEGMQISTGFGFFHLLKPKKSFIDANYLDSLGEDIGKEDRMGVFHSSARIALTREIDLLPALLYQRKKKAQELMAGTSVGFSFIKGRKTRGIVLVGGWLRFFENIDAFILSTGLEYESFTLGISYDVNISSLKQSVDVFGRPGGPEFSLIYEFPIPAKRKRKPIPCPRFD
ncbi:MAG: PorP/SprF family type IX secretion system membrane protein [Bacteroidetes bacterium]|nr:PorP/SprF family type IX secretion system membrane protein [Bacteroidota bacterium]